MQITRRLVLASAAATALLPARVNAAGRRLARPLQIHRGPKSDFVPIGRRVEARHLAALENGDLVAVHCVKTDRSDAAPPLASIVHIAAAS